MTDADRGRDGGDGNEDGERDDDTAPIDGDRPGDAAATDGPNAGSTADEDPDPPRRWVEQLLAREETVRELLAEVERARMLDDHDEVRSTVRDLADGDEDVFRAVAYAVDGTDRFFEELREQYDDPDPVERVADLGERYADLADEFDRVWGETFRGMKNPDPGIRARYGYSERHDLPLLAYELHSGDLELAAAKQPPSQALMVAGMLVDDTADLLERVRESGDDISEREATVLALVLDRLTDDVGRLLSEVDGFDADAFENVELDLEPDVDGPEDPYDSGWGFY